MPYERSFEAYDADVNRCSRSFWGTAAVIELAWYVVGA